MLVCIIPPLPPSTSSAPLPADRLCLQSSCKCSRMLPLDLISMALDTRIWKYALWPFLPVSPKVDRIQWEFGKEQHELDSQSSQLDDISGPWDPVMSYLIYLRSLPGRVLSLLSPFSGLVSAFPKGRRRWRFCQVSMKMMTPGAERKEKW